jgi:hypothetical protein
MSPARPVTAGYSGTPLTKKLGIKEGFRCFYSHAPADYPRMLGTLPSSVKVERLLSGEFDFIHGFFANTKSFQAELPKLRDHLKKSGLLWISWRKGKVSDLSEDVVRRIALESGLVDVKVCAVDETWSGLKLVYRLRDR